MARPHPSGPEESRLDSSGPEPVPSRAAILAEPEKLDVVVAGQESVFLLHEVNLSKNMAMLLQAGIVDATRDGRQVRYRLAHPEIHEACVIMRSVLYQRLKQGEKLASAIGSPRG